MAIRNILVFILLITGTIYAQKPTQTIRGRIVDAETRVSLPGASVILVSDTTNFKGTVTDTSGYYRLTEIPVGRHAVKVTFIGYEPLYISNIVVTSGKEVVLNLELIESMVEMEEVEITATKKSETNNEMATVSARQFSVEETERYAGSRGDPARMASNFAGVQGADDSRNDIVIRGNSPMSVLWRLEGIDIPNPNHFAVAGTAGGPVSIINNKSLSNSDFFTGAFPAEYGNTISGVFDLRMRNGNNEKHEFTGQFGFLGTELMAEGPISRTKHSSYMGGYRYSTVSIFNALGIDIGTSAVPRYQDGFFKVNFPKEKGNISVFGLGGYSDIDIVISNQLKPEREIYGDQDRDQYFTTGMGIVGTSYTRTFNSSTYGKFTLAQSFQHMSSIHEKIYRHIDPSGYFVIDSTRHKQAYVMEIAKSSFSWFVNKKLRKNHVLKFGMNSDLFSYNFVDSVLNEKSFEFLHRLGSQENSLLLQPYFQWKYRINPELTLVTGIHSQFYTLNKSYSPVEPRFGLEWQISGKQAISLGTGLHSQLQPDYIYFHEFTLDNGIRMIHNQHLDFTKSLHTVLGYQYLPGKNVRLKAEAYYQYLYDIPVENISSSVSLINQGTGFTRFFPDQVMVNEGLGTNYGGELTLEKFFSKQYLFMATVSLYESQYQGSDGMWRDTDFNGNYIYNVLASKEFKIRGKSVITLGTKITGAGGRRYSPVDTTASAEIGEIVYEDKTRNSLQLDNYFRWDLKINYRINSKKITHEVALDLVNVLNTENVLKLTYAPDPANPSASPIRKEFQLGFLPIFYYKIDF